MEMPEMEFEGLLKLTARGQALLDELNKELHSPGRIARDPKGLEPMGSAWAVLSLVKRDGLKRLNLQPPELQAEIRMVARVFFEAGFIEEDAAEGREAQSNVQKMSYGELQSLAEKHGFDPSFSEDMLRSILSNPHYR